MLKEWSKPNIETLNIKDTLVLVTKYCYFSNHEGRWDHCPRGYQSYPYPDCSTGVSEETGPDRCELCSES